MGAAAILAAAVAVPVGAQSQPAPQREQNDTQQTTPASSAPLSAEAPLADPVVRADASLTATRATAWSEGDAQHLLLDGDVRFELGAYGFRAQRAVVRIDTQATPGRTLRHLALYLEGAQPIHGAGPVTAEAPRLLVTATTEGGVTLGADAFEKAVQPPAQPLVNQARDRIARHRQKLRQATAEAFAPQALFTPQVEVVREARRARIAQQQLARQVETLPGAVDEPAGRPEPVAAEGVAAEETSPDVEDPAAAPVLPTSGAVYLSYAQAAGSTDENYLMLIGDVRLVYQDFEGDREVALTAERAVLFTRPGDDEDADRAADAGAQLAAGDIEGIYLEDNVVVTDGAFTVRAPRMYFDLQQNKAVLLEAVLYTYDVQRRVPLYLRADVVRQVSATQFEAEDALLTTSEFAEPHFAIGSDRVTINRRADAQGAGGGIDSYTASHNTLRWGGVPFFYWPYLAGVNRDSPLRSIGGSYSSKDGFVLETTWDLFALAGRERPQGFDLLARIDYQGHHGPGVGLLADYNRPEMFGQLDSYLLPKDTGEDDVAGRPDIDHDGDTRGFVRWQHRQNLQQNWELSLEGSYVSDETFLEEFFRSEAYEARDYETSAYLKKQEDDWAVTLLAKYDVNGFVPQLTTLQAPGYLVDKMPELGYYRVGTSLWDDRLTYFTENRVGRMRLVFGDDAPEDRGFRLSQSLLNFGIPHDMTFKDAAEDAGLSDDWVHRFDSRHEINAPMRLGMFSLTPYAVGRFTGYDDDFDEFSDEDDQIRLWGQIGARTTTQIVATYDDAAISLLDVNRLRHIIEPSVDVFASASTLDSEDLPVYDQMVENIDDGSGIRFGLTNTFQTQRGGPGRWRSVDWIRLQTDVVLREEDDHRFGGAADSDAQLARFFRYRPEFGTGGDHFYTELLWLVSDTLGVIGELTHDLETDRITQWRVGMSLQHTPRLASYVDYEELEVLDLKLLTYGFSYQITTKYLVGFHHRLDFSESRSRGMSLSLDRRLPRWRLRLVGDYDEIDDETTLGIVLLPEGFDLRAPRIPLDQFFQPN